MTYLRTGVVLLVMAVLGCATVHSRMMKSADTLGSSANAFAGDAGRDLPHVVEFASETRSFLATVDQASDREVISAYERLWDKYQALREEVERSHSPDAHVDFKAVSQAFTDVVHDVRGYSDADGSIYARGGFQHDPYYDP
jgi:uncharacterized protein YifE (UPF0438 family)